MWSLRASLELHTSGHCASTLGVGHFTVPPDVIAEGPDALPSASGELTESPIRAIVVPHGITAVPRRSPTKTRNRTPWYPTPDAQCVVERGGGREWFSDRLFVESRQANLPGACSTSAAVHAVLVLLVLLLLGARAVRADLTPGRTVSLRMPPMELLLPVLIAPPPARQSTAAPLPAKPSRTAPPPLAQTIAAPAAVPLETPSSVEPETSMPAETPSEDAIPGAEVSGATNGMAGGVPGSSGSGASIGPAHAPEAPSLLRVGEGGIDQPRKIKDVRPVYPPPAMAARVGGNVMIEATIGVDGKVHNTRLLRSIALLDQAALDAVRQWEFEPSRLNGVPVAVMMVVVVTFALL